MLKINAIQSMSYMYLISRPSVIKPTLCDFTTIIVEAKSAMLDKHSHIVYLFIYFNYWVDSGGI